MLWGTAGRSTEAGMQSSAFPGKPRPAPWGGQGSACQSVNTSKARRRRRRRGNEEIEALLSKKVQVGAISQLFEL